MQSLIRARRVENGNDVALVIFCLLPLRSMIFVEFLEEVRLEQVSLKASFI